jgi:hypothetical protein
MLTYNKRLFIKNHQLGNYPARRLIMKLTLNQQLMLQQAWFDREEPLEWRTPAGMTEGGVTRAVNALIALGLLTQEKTITEIGEEAFWELPRI